MYVQAANKNALQHFTQLLKTRKLLPVAFIGRDMPNVAVPTLAI